MLSLHVQPRASRDEVVGVRGDRLKLRITAPPVDGSANAHLVRYLARQFCVPKSQVEILSGESGRDKRLAIRQPREIPAWLSGAPGYCASPSTAPQASQ